MLDTEDMTGLDHANGDGPDDEILALCEEYGL